MKLKGAVVDGKSEGKWEYFYESGEKEGEAVFKNGKGEYIGYYRNSDKKMIGDIEDGVKIGTWELYDHNGVLAGYYKPIYEDYEPLLRTAKIKVIFQKKVNSTPSLTIDINQKAVPILNQEITISQP